VDTQAIVKKHGDICGVTNHCDFSDLDSAKNLLRRIPEESDEGATPKVAAPIMPGPIIPALQRPEPPQALKMQVTIQCDVSGLNAPKKMKPIVKL
jgi:hypothetical protein